MGMYRFVDMEHFVDAADIADYLHYLDMHHLAGEVRTADWQYFGDKHHPESAELIVN